MKVVYVAGAYRAGTRWDIAQNVRRAEEAALAVAHLGAMPLCPHANGHNFDGQKPDEFWVEGTLELMRRCDAVFVFNRAHVEVSDGTRGEVKEAFRLDIPVFYSPIALGKWIQGEAVAHG